MSRKGTSRGLPKNDENGRVVTDPDPETRNDSGTQQIDIPTSEDVFNFMVKNMEGKGTPEDIRHKSKLFPTEVDITDWFRKNKDRFTLIERNGDIACVLVYDRRATYCIDYGRKSSCRRSNCQRYHICRNLCSGKCFLGRRCNFSHNLFDEHNGNISDALGFSKTFSNDEVCFILRLSFPRVCTTWSSKGACTDVNCPDLHICSGYILGKCKDGQNCPNIHDRNTDHNGAILQAFEMTEMKDEIFKWRVFVLQTPAWTRNEQTVPGAAASTGSRMRSLVSEEAGKYNIIAFTQLLHISLKVCKAISYKIFRKGIKKYKMCSIIINPFTFLTNSAYPYYLLHTIRI